jgi:hypothetical protein
LLTRSANANDVLSQARYGAGLVRAWSACSSTRMNSTSCPPSIGRDLEGKNHAPPAVVDALRAHLGPLGVDLAESATYPMHPSTLAWDHTLARPGGVLCLEVRRDLVVAVFDPFVEEARRRREGGAARDPDRRIAAPLLVVAGRAGEPRGLCPLRACRVADDRRAVRARGPAALERGPVEHRADLREHGVQAEPQAEQEQHPPG